MIEIHELSPSTILPMAQMMKEMWPHVDLEEEVANNSRIYRDPSQTAFLMSMGDNWIGFAYMALRRDFVEGTSSSPVAYLEGIYIRENHRKKGYATTLLSKAEEWAKVHGAIELGSDTEIFNKISQDFHVATGFKEINRIVCYAKKL